MELNRTFFDKVYNEVSNSMDMDINVVTATDHLKSVFSIDRGLAKILTEAQYLIYGNDTVIFEITSKPDSFGKQVFFIYRWAWDITTNKEQWGGQAFRANLEEHVKRVEQQGKKIYTINNF
jgi:hypothetical protein